MRVRRSACRWAMHLSWCLIMPMLFRTLLERRWLLLSYAHGRARAKSTADSAGAMHHVPTRPGTRPIATVHVVELRSKRQPICHLSLRAGAPTSRPPREYHALPTDSIFFTRDHPHFTSSIRVLFEVQIKAHRLDVDIDFGIFDFDYSPSTRGVHSGIRAPP